MPLACDFIGFVNVTHVNLRKPDQQDEDHVAVDVKINGALEGDVLAKLKGCQPVDVANNWFPEYQDEEQSPRFTNEVKTALNNEYKEHYLILDGHQFRANIKKMEYQVTKQKRIDLTFSATIDPVSESEILFLARLLSGWAKCRIDHDPDLFTAQEAEEALAGAIREQQEQMEY
jgi:hypothetical protein